ncbi:MAG: Uma2 family endonuclease [Leptolyngbyaceae cyanobacterium bins.349]|nr:Uma2 family endonuclease [Leptolyngbyaceae cyanobacterium bins.349]
MVVPPPSPPTPAALRPIGEQRVLFHDLTWDAYLQLLQLLGNNRASRLTYDQGTLEITMPLEDHEFAVRLIELFIRILVVESGLDLKTMGSTTLNRRDLQRGAEPDNGFYIQNRSQVAGRTVDLMQDPPPDLIVEVDITHTDINKFRLYASLGTPEFWRYNGQDWRIYQLQEEQCVEVETSPTFPFVPKAKLYEFLEQGQQSEAAAEKALRAWVQGVKLD